MFCEQKKEVLFFLKPAKKEDVRHRIRKGKLCGHDNDHPHIEDRLFVWGGEREGTGRWGDGSESWRNFFFEI